MPVTTTLYTKAGAEAGTVDLPEALFAAPVNTAVLHQAVVAQLAGAPDRHGRHQDPRRGPRRRQEAVPPEGHRPRPPGHAARAPHYAGGGVVFGPHPRGVRAAAAQAHAPPGAPGRPDLQVRRRRHQVRRRPRRSTPSRPASWSGYLDALQARGRVLVVEAGKDERLELSARNLPGVHGHPRRLAQRGRRPERGHAGHHPAVHRRRWRRCTHDAPGIAGHPAPGHQREVDGRDAASTSTRSRSTTTPTSCRSRPPSRSSSRSRCWTSTCSTTKPKEKSRNRKRGRIKGCTSPWKKAVVTVEVQRQDRILRGGVGDAAAQLQADLPRSAVHDPLDLRGDHHRPRPTSRCSSPRSAAAAATTRAA